MHQQHGSVTLRMKTPLLTTVSTLTTYKNDNMTPPFSHAVQTCSEAAPGALKFTAAAGKAYVVVLTSSVNSLGRAFRANLTGTVGWARGHLFQASLSFGSSCELCDGAGAHTGWRSLLLAFNAAFDCSPQYYLIKVARS